MSRLRLRIAAGGFAAAAALFVLSASAAVGPAPQLGLVTAVSSVQVVKYGNQPVYLDLGVYLAARDATFRLDVRRDRYVDPITVTEMLPGGSRQLPLWTADGWNGLAQFIHYTFRNTQGAVVAQRTTSLCPDSYGLQRVDSTGPLAPTFPSFCGTNPFTLGSVWGLNRGWAVPLADNAPQVPLALGTYTATVSIDPRYAQLFGIATSAASTTLKLSVVKPPACPPCVPTHAAPAARYWAPRLPTAPLTLHPNPATEPDLIPLPAWGMSTQRSSGRDYLDFGATIWDAGRAPMDIEGFRQPGTETMNAFQYFFRNGKVVGRAPAGTLLFDSGPTEQEWHFEQFAGYSLLDHTQRQVVRSRKVGFCLAPTDALDLLVPGAVWQPYSIGLQGACGYASSLWTRETLPSGWGDTYVQSQPEQAFDITALANGIYYVKVQANPLDQIHEVTRTNDIRLRMIVLGGAPGHRTVKVPAWNGIDPEPTP